VIDRGRWAGLRPGERPYAGAAWFYAEYRYRPSAAFAAGLAGHLGWSRSDRVLDIGAGPAHLTLLLAPLVGEVVAMDPEPDMLDEGRRRAAAAGIDNVGFVEGGSDDLTRLAATLGSFTAVTISQAFHWMRDQDAVLRALDDLLDARRGAVALVGYVKEPDYGAMGWLDRAPWCRATEIRERYLRETPEGPSPAGRHDPYPTLLARSAFSEVELYVHEYETVVKPSSEAAIGHGYSLSNVLHRLGARRAAYEEEVRQALEGADTTPLTVSLVDSALVGRRP
jgi:SAM-dependent methyltransferase